MQEPTDIKGVQQLTGRLASLSHFISRLGERTLPFYQLLRKGEKFEWIEESRKAFADLKKTLSTPPILVLPKEGEKLYLYVEAHNSVVSTALVVERMEEGKIQSIQRPIYYLSMLLNKYQQRYPRYQKLLLAIVMTSRRTTSSQTTTRSSQPPNSRTFAKSWASKSTTHQSHTCSPTT